MKSEIDSGVGSAAEDSGEGGSSQAWSLAGSGGGGSGVPKST